MPNQIHLTNYLIEPILALKWLIVLGLDLLCLSVIILVIIFSSRSLAKNSQKLANRPKSKKIDQAPSD